MRQNISSGVIKSLFCKLRIKVECTSAVIFLWDITKEKNEKRLNYCIEEWHTSTPYDIFHNQSTFTSVCLILETWHRTNHCITVCDKWIFDSNFEVAFPLTQDCLNYICCSNGIDENKFFGVLHDIRVVPPEVVRVILNIK